MQRRRQFRLPVLSRLTWAWLTAFVITGVLGGVFVQSITSEKGPGRIALPIEQLEHIARPDRAPGENGPAAAAAPDKGLRLSAPNLRDGGAAGAPENESDAPAGASGFLVDTDDRIDIENDEAGAGTGAIVITIDGKVHGEEPAGGAALAAPVRANPIPDPDPALLRATPLGKAPRIAPDGRNALTAYARPFNGDYTKPRIAIIVGGLGLNPGLTERAIDELPPEISLAFAPYAKDLEFWTKKARDAGHEILIELPMEGYGQNQEALGAAALLSTRTEQENLQRLDWLLSRFGAYFAATNYLGAKFSTDENALRPVLKKLAEAGVGYIDDTGAASRAGAAMGAALAEVDVVISPAPDDRGRRAVRRELETLEKAAARKGSAIGKTYAYAATLEEIAAWAAKLDDEGFSPAPASAVLRARTASR